MGSGSGGCMNKSRGLEQLNYMRENAYVIVLNRQLRLLPSERIFLQHTVCWLCPVLKSEASS